MTFDPPQPSPRRWRRVVPAVLLAALAQFPPDAAVHAQSTPKSEIFVPSAKAPAVPTAPSPTAAPRRQTAAPPPATQTFVRPKLNGYWVDRCLSWGAQCNQPAADEFCRRKGYARASDFSWAGMSPTRILSSGQVCNLPICGGFTQVVCRR